MFDLRLSHHPHAQMNDPTSGWAASAIAQAELGGRAKGQLPALCMQVVAWTLRLQR